MEICANGGTDVLTESLPGERERECVCVYVCDGTGILFEEPNPTGSRPSDLIGLYKLFKRETEHLH